MINYYAFAVLLSKITDSCIAKFQILLVNPLFHCGSFCVAVAEFALHNSTTYLWRLLYEDSLRQSEYRLFLGLAFESVTQFLIDDQVPSKNYKIKFKSVRHFAIKIHLICLSNFTCSSCRATVDAKPTTKGVGHGVGKPIP